METSQTEERVMVDAYIDPAWTAGDGITVVFAENPQDAARQLDMDAGREPKRYLPADGMQGTATADRYALLLMTGDVAIADCLGCCGAITRAGHDDKNGSPRGWCLSCAEARDSPEHRPVRVEGLGLFCSEACWDAYVIVRGALHVEDV